MTGHVDPITFAADAGRDAVKTYVEAGRRATVNFARDRLDSGVDAAFKGVKEYENWVGAGREGAEALLPESSKLAKEAHELNAAVACSVRAAITDNAQGLKAMLGCRDLEGVIGVRRSLFNMNVKRVMSNGRRLTDAWLRLGLEASETILDTAVPRGRA